MDAVAGGVSVVGLISDWRPDWLVLALALAVGVGCLRARRRLAGAAAGPRPPGGSAPATGAGWPVRRDLYLTLGLVAMVWTSSGFPNARAEQLMWVWTSQQLLLLLIVPIIVLAGQPVALLRATGSGTWLLRALRSRPLEMLGSPLVGPLLVPVICLLLFFGGLGQAALVHPWLGSLVAVALLLVGALIVLPLIDTDDDRSSLAVGLALAVGFVELILDAFPGIALRFSTHLRVPYFGVARPGWAGSWLDDQHSAGGILWVVAELLDLPFLILAATRWIRADAREAARIDAELDAKDATALRTPPIRPAATPPAGTRVAVADPARPADPGGPTDSAGPTDPARAADPGRPWWLDDPRFSDRYR